MATCDRSMPKTDTGSAGNTTLPNNSLPNNTLPNNSLPNNRLPGNDLPDPFSKQGQANSTNRQQSSPDQFANDLLKYATSVVVEGAGGIQGSQLLGIFANHGEGLHRVAGAAGFRPLPRRPPTCPGSMRTRSRDPTGRARSLAAPCAASSRSRFATIPPASGQPASCGASTRAAHRTAIDRSADVADDTVA